MYKLLLARKQAQRQLAKEEEQADFILLAQELNTRCSALERETFYALPKARIQGQRKRWHDLVSMIPATY